MGKTRKTKEQLVSELAEARARIAELEASEAECKRVEEALRASEERFALIERYANDGIYDHDIVNDAIYWSPRLKEILGYADGELDLDLETFEASVHPDDKEHVLAALEAHLKDRVPFDVEERLRTKSGEYRWLRVRGQAVWDEEGRPIRIVGSNTDITERKAAEEALERRALQLQTAGEVSRAASSILDPGELIQQVVDLVRERFDLYYVGLFLLDEERKFAVLRAGTGEAGRRMLEAGHKLEVGGQSMIGWCIANAQARIALDVGEEAVRFDNPLLPETRSEMALPLVSRGQVIGAMTVQSTQVAAFSEEDITVLQTMADQLANAIENARLFEDTKSRLAQLTALQETTKAVASTLELDKLLNLIVQQATTLFQGTGGIINLVDWEKKEDEVVVANGSVASALGWRSPLEGSLGGWVALHNQPVISNQLQNDDRVDSRVRSGGLPVQSAAIAPLTTKDQVIGTLVVQDKQGGKGEFNQADLDLLVAFANQAATAIENARLYEELTGELAERKAAEEALQKAYADVEKRVEERTAELQREIAERERLQQEVIEAQKQTLQELSTPIIPIMERIIVMPLIGSIDSMRAKDIMRALLGGIRQHRARVVILDITGVPLVDSGVANHLNKTIQAARLKGAQTIVTGISDAVAEAIVDLGIDWGGVETLADLQTGLMVALAKMGLRIEG